MVLVGKAETVLNAWMDGVIGYHFALNRLYWAGEQPGLPRRKFG